MANFNKVILVGNLTRDPELRYLPSNMAVCEFGLAVNHRWRDREGNQKEEVCFVDVSAFGRSGETINQYMSKGRSILVEGRLKYDQWTAQDGTKRSKLHVIAENFTFLGGGDRGPRGESPEGAPRARSGAAPADRAPRDRGPAPDDQPPPGDDIPF